MLERHDTVRKCGDQRGLTCYECKRVCFKSRVEVRNNNNFHFSLSEFVSKYLVENCAQKYCNNYCIHEVGLFNLVLGETHNHSNFPKVFLVFI